MKIMGIYDPVVAKKENAIVTFDVTGRTYTFTDKSCFPSSIKSKGYELLSSPITVKASVNGISCNFSPVDTRLIYGGSPECRTSVSSMMTDNFMVDVIHNVEFDGFDTINLNIAPLSFMPGDTSALFGKSWDNQIHLDYLYVDVPISKKHVRYYHVYPGLDWDYARSKGIEDSCAGIIPKGGFSTDFREQIYLCGDEVGIGFIFESDEKWNYADDVKVFEVIDEGDSYVLRLHFYDVEPKQWKDKGKNGKNSRNVFPISLKFAMQVTPIKPITDEMFFDKSIQLDCQKRFPQEHDEWLLSPVMPNSDEIGIDRLKRLGVETLYIHEKWNDIQNSFILTEEARSRLELIIKECHKRDMKIVPYFGYEISTLSPLFNEYGDKFRITLYNEGESNWFWCRTPAQRAMPVCMNSGWRDVFYNGIKTLYEELGFDGFYFDGSYQPRGCVNDKHGCGYTDETGKVHRTFTPFATREFAKSVYKLVEEKGGVVNFHPSGCQNLAVLGFCSSLFEGEFFQGEFIHGQLDDMPEPLLRAIIDGHNTGVPVVGTVYVTEKWSYHQALGMLLLHWAPPKTVCWEDGLEELSKIWKVYDAFKSSDVVWKPYYKDGCPVTSPTEYVKVSCYEKENQILAIVATTNKNFSGKAKVVSKHSKVTDAISGKVLSNKGDAEVELCGFDYKLLIIDK